MERYGPYTATERIGIGGMGKVVKAFINPYREEYFREFLRMPNLTPEARQLRETLLGFEGQSFPLGREEIDRLIERKAEWFDSMIPGDRQQEGIRQSEYNLVRRTMTAYMGWAETSGMKRFERARIYKSDTIWRAIKIMHPTWTDDTVSAGRFQQESTVQLDHDNIIPVYDTGEYDGQNVIVQKYVPSADLESAAMFEGGIKVKHRGGVMPLPIPHAVDIIKRVLYALDYAHNNPVKTFVHRDVKPSNILWDPETDDVYLCDFGLMKPTNPEDDPNFTRTEQVPGSPSYIAPEQAVKKKQLTPRVDVYGAGASLCKLLTGEPPVGASSSYIAAALVINGAGIFPDEHNMLVTGELSDLVRQMCAVDPEDRYTEREAIAEMDRLEEEGLLENRVTETGRRYHIIDTTMIQRAQQLEDFKRRKQERDAEKEQEQGSAITRIFNRVRGRASLDRQLEEEEKGLMQGHEIENAESLETMAGFEGRTQPESAIRRFEYLKEAHDFYEAWMDNNHPEGFEMLRSTEIDLSKLQAIRPDPTIDYGPYGQPEAVQPEHIIDRIRKLRKNMSHEIARYKHLTGQERCREEAEEIKRLEAILNQCKRKPAE